MSATDYAYLESIEISPRSEKGVRIRGTLKSPRKGYSKLHVTATDADSAMKSLLCICAEGCLVDGEQFLSGKDQGYLRLILSVEAAEIDKRLPTVGAKVRLRNIVGDAIPPLDAQLVEKYQKGEVE